MELFRGISFLKTLSLNEILLFFVYVILIFIVKWGLLYFLRNWMKSDWAKNRVLPTIQAILNWATFYGTILLFLFYFSNESWLFSPIYEKDGVEVSFILIIVAIMIITFTSRLVKAFTAHIMPFIYEKFGVDMGLSFTINRLIYYVVMIIALLISFQTVGLDMRAFTVVLSTLGIGIGFGLRNVAANFVSGIIILFERPMEVGETVEIEEKVGQISKINLRSTVITHKGGKLVVPNQYFIEQIINSHSGEQLTAEVKVSVPFGTDSYKVEALLREAAKSLQDAPTPTIRFVDFIQSAMEFSVQLSVQNGAAKDDIENKLRHAIADIFSKNNIKLASCADTIHISKDP
ncbi:mechanosensitive ion channel family protein [Lederbergia wuyishanensis]|uniref:Potassium efflux system protein n=1 Tax=Lederbergia wuyishanensis TaxID=1347903 RepID=A0ABU0D460_9BACI|nr:mechanosensitive ion channel domain-containing protein [Lederbergia wuyishanensis]MCJ8008218.1 mechanosensitive ion channel [Lederbergia wuyishanensis]MDQ0343193.1 potassium efflux system protein [Lederbergia wuyishanensis]